MFNNNKFHFLKLLIQIGKGSYGKILLVRKKASMEVFALKVLKKEKIIKEHQVEHTNTERKVLTEIDNPFKF